LAGHHRGEFSLNEKHLLGKDHNHLRAPTFAGRGFRRDVIRSAITGLARKGYTDRVQAQRRRDGAWSFAREALTDKARPASRAAGQHVKRAWFDGRWSVKQGAVILFLRAKGAASIAEIAKRFRWHRGTASALVSEMLAVEYLIESDRAGCRARVFKAAQTSTSGQLKDGSATNSKTSRDLPSATNRGQDVGNPGNGDDEKDVNGDVGFPGNTLTLRGQHTNPSGKEPHTLRGNTTHPTG
jgi:hypothetical protein